MPYAGQGSYNGQRAEPSHAYNTLPSAQYPHYPHFQSPNPVTYGSFTPSQPHVNGSHQHRPINPQNSQVTSHPAYAVAIPPASPSPAPISRDQVPRGPSVVHHGPIRNISNAANGHISMPPAQGARAEAPLNHQVLLLSLAEEYFEAAYSQDPMADINQPSTEMQTYSKLIATGLGCLEAVLRHFKSMPERECIVRLRYASVLHQETTNTMEAEEALSKGISLADRHHFYDLKYNMQHLLARILFQKSPRAAFKFLDGIVQDAQAYQHIAWVYAFNFLAVSLHLEGSSHQDLLAARTQLRKIISMSSDYGDKTILATSTTLEAFTCLRLSSDTESIEQSQRALASVRSLQLDSKLGELHQLTVLTSLIDLCCHLLQFDPTQALAKMQVMQLALKNMENGQSWTADGLFTIPVPNARMPSCRTRNGVIRKLEDNALVLMFNWMSKDDIYNLGYLLSGLALVHRNATDGQKTEHMLTEGVRKFQYADRSTNNTSIPKSVGQAHSRKLWRDQMICHMRLHQAFALCARSQWLAAKEQQSAIHDSLKIISASLDPVPESLLLLTAYLGAVLLQGTGYTNEALYEYQSESLSIQSCRKIQHPSQLRLDISLLSALNTLLIIQSPGHPKGDQMKSLLSLIEHLCLRNPNRQIQSAYHLVKTSTNSSATILVTKQALQSALQTAKKSDNKQVMCMVLNFMSWKFFRGVVGDQAEKSARVSQRLAQQCMDILWTSVAAGVLGDTLEAAGRIEEAKKARQSGETTANTLPEKIQEFMKKEREPEDVVMMDEDQEISMFGGL